MARRAELPKDRMVVMHCHSGSLSAQAVFALRLLGYYNVKALQDGIESFDGRPTGSGSDRACDVRQSGHDGKAAARAGANIRRHEGPSLESARPGPFAGGDVIRKRSAGQGTDA